MGIDCEIYVRFNTELTERELQELEEDMREAMDFSDPCFTRVSFDKDYSELAQEGGSLICLENGWRYYGIGYERGPLHLISAHCDYLYYKTSGNVFYGGDSGVGLIEWTPELRETLWRHFAKHGHRPYRGTER